MATVITEPSDVRTLDMTTRGLGFGFGFGLGFGVGEGEGEGDGVGLLAAAVVLLTGTTELTGLPLHAVSVVAAVAMTRAIPTLTRGEPRGEPSGETGRTRAL